MISQLRVLLTRLLAWLINTSPTLVKEIQHQNPKADETEEEKEEEKQEDNAPSPSPSQLKADDSFRNPKWSHDSLLDTTILGTNDTLPDPTLSSLLAASPALKIYTRSSPSFGPLRTVYQLDTAAQPLLITRPVDKTQVAAIVTHAAREKTPLTVRSGGHDGSGRSCVQDAIVIDMRELDHIHLDSRKKSAKMGGGVTAVNLTRFLDTHGLVAAVGECNTVGWANWAMCGGYGVLNGSFGLGVDQIVGAQVVNASGCVVDADEETLWGIRGAGGNFGVVVELEIKVHFLPRMLAGMIAFSISEARGVLSGYQGLLDEAGVPDAWGGGLGVFRVPGVGVVVLMLATWAEESLERGWEWMAKIRGLGSAVFDTVSETSFKEFMEHSGSLGPPGSFQWVEAPYVEKLSTEMIDIIIKYAAKMPDDPACMINLHTCHGVAAQPNKGASFGKRCQHMIAEVIGATVNESSKDEVYTWCAEMGAEIRRKGLAMEGGYINLMRAEDTVDDCFGNDWEQLKALKRKLDPENVFAFAVPSLV